MYLTEVIPITNIPREHPQILSYFSTESLNRGAVVSISLRNRSIPALVLLQHDISSQKTQLKKSSFALKKINQKITENPVFSDSDFEFLKWFANYYFLPLGLALKTMLPERIIKAKRPLSFEFAKPAKSTSAKSKQKPLLYFSENRIDFYIENIKKAYDNGKQILFLVPDYISAEYFYNKLCDVFNKNEIAFFEAGQTPKSFFENWQRVAQNKIKIIIGTRSAVFLKFADLGLIIIEREEDQSLKSWDMKPYYNAKECAFKLSEIFNAKIILGSNTPSIESYHFSKTSSLDLIKEETKPIGGQVVNMRDEIRMGNDIISEELIDKIKILKDKKGQASPQSSGQAIIFVNRRGLATFIFCQECGFILKCKDCDSPLVFHKEIKNEKHRLICHYCNNFSQAPDACPNCNGHKIKYSGIGSQKAEETLKNIFPNLKIVRVDSETITPQKNLQSIISEYNNGKIDILIGTQLLLNKPDIKADLVAILSIDTIINLPEFRTQERIYQIINQLKSYLRTPDTPFLIQTFKPEEDTFIHSLNSDFESIYANEIEARELLKYPPFSQLIKLTFKDTNPKTAFLEARKAADILQKECEKITASNELTKNNKDCIIIGPAPGFISKVKGQYVYNVIVKSNLGATERNHLLNSAINSKWKIDVDPITLI